MVHLQDAGCIFRCFDAIDVSDAATQPMIQKQLIHVFRCMVFMELLMKPSKAFWSMLMTRGLSKPLTQRLLSMLLLHLSALMMIGLSILMLMILFSFFCSCVVFLWNLSGTSMTLLLLIFSLMLFFMMINLISIPPLL